jgi:hypothetical protein
MGPVTPMTGSRGWGRCGRCGHPPARPFRSGTSARSLTRYNVSHLSVPPRQFVLNKTYDQGSPETGNETHAWDAAQRVSMIQARRRRSPWRRMRDSNSRGLAPNTLSKYAPQRSGQAGVVRDLGGLQLVGLGGRPRTQANETANETGRLGGLILASLVRHIVPRLTCSSSVRGLRRGVAGGAVSGPLSQGTRRGWG